MKDNITIHIQELLLKDYNEKYINGLVAYLEQKRIKIDDVLSGQIEGILTVFDEKLLGVEELFGILVAYVESGLRKHLNTEELFAKHMPRLSFDAWEEDKRKKLMEQTSVFEVKCVENLTRIRAYALVLLTKQLDAFDITREALRRGLVSSFVSSGHNPPPAWLLGMHHEEIASIKKDEAHADRKFALDRIATGFCSDNRKETGTMVKLATIKRQYPDLDTLTSDSLGFGKDNPPFTI